MTITILLYYHSSTHLRAFTPFCNVFCLGSKFSHRRSICLEQAYYPTGYASPTSRKSLKFNKAVLVFKAYRNLAPQCPKDLFICYNSRAQSRSMILPKPTIDLFKTSFSFAGASLWNSIPTHITSCNTHQLQNAAPKMAQN